jgi:hypothetical protein
MKIRGKPRDGCHTKPGLTVSAMNTCLLDGIQHNAFPGA